MTVVTKTLTSPLCAVVSCINFFTITSMFFSFPFSANKAVLEKQKKKNFFDQNNMVEQNRKQVAFQNSIYIQRKFLVGSANFARSQTSIIAASLVSLGTEGSFVNCAKIGLVFIASIISERSNSIFSKALSFTAAMYSHEAKFPDSPTKATGTWNNNTTSITKIQLCLIQQSKPLWWFSHLWNNVIYIEAITISTKTN